MMPDFFGEKKKFPQFNVKMAEKQRLQNVVFNSF